MTFQSVSMAIQSVSVLFVVGSFIVWRIENRRSIRSLQEQMNWISQRIDRIENREGRK